MKLFTVVACQFRILRIMFKFLIAASKPAVHEFVFSSPRLIKKCISLQGAFKESTPFLTFCGGISSGTGIIHGPIS